MLPFLEQQPLCDKFDHTQPITAQANEAARSVWLPVMLCPSDAYNRQPFIGTQGWYTGSFGDNWARGNYAANASFGFPYEASIGAISAGGPSSRGWANSILRGVMGNNVSVGIAQIGDGTSHTVALGKLRGHHALRHAWHVGLGRRC